MADLENSTDLLRQALDEIRKKGIVTAETLDSLNKSLKKSQKIIDDETKDREQLAKEAEEAAKRTKELVQGFKDITRNIGSAAQGVRDNRDDFRSLKPAVDAFGKAASLGAGKLGEGISALGNIISGVSIALGPIGKLIGSGVGFAVSTLGDQVKKHGKEVVEFATLYAKFSLDEIQRVVGAYHELSKYGGVTAQGFKGLQADSQALGMSMDQYAKLIAQNSQGLAAAGGTVTAGAAAVKDITVASKDFERQFLGMGIGFAEQRDLTAKFLSYQRINTQLNLRDTAALTRANKEYIELLDEVSRLTGKSRDKIALDMEAAAREVGYGATLSMAERMGSRDAIIKVQEYIGARMGPAAVEAFKASFGGPQRSELAKQLEIITGGMASTYAKQLQRREITDEQYITLMRDAMRRFQGSAEAMDYFEQATAGLQTPIEQVLPLLRQYANLTDDQIKGLVTAKQDSTEAGKVKGKENEAIVDAQINLRNMAVEIDKIVTQKLFPTMAKSVRQLTGVLEAGASTLAKVLGVEVPSGDATTTGGGGAAGGGGGATKPAFSTQPKSFGQGGKGASQDYLSRVGQLESRGRNIGNVPLPGRKATGAFGIYQITPRTFESLVANAPPGSPLKGKTFEEMKADTNLQTEAMKALTADNERLLAQRGLSTSDAAKYMAHMLGYGVAARVLEARASASLDTLIPRDALLNNNLAKFGTAGALRNHFDQITGGQGYQFGGIASGPRSGYVSMLHGTEAVIPLPGGRSVPVEMTGMTDKMGEQISMLTAQTGMLSDLVDLMRTSVFTQEKIYRATAH